MFKLLLAHPDAKVSSKIAGILGKKNITVSCFEDLEAALGGFQDNLYHMLVLSERFDQPTLRLMIDQAHVVNEKFPVILVSNGSKSSEESRDQNGLGAMVFPEPLDPKLLEQFCLQKAEELRLRNQVAYLRHREPYIYNFEQIIGHDSGLSDVFESIKKVSRSNVSVLLMGETGTGKELIAAAIHYNSFRKEENFVAVNCAALHENLLESELFGHEKGAFTGADKRRVGRFEQADAGTLFLDEIGEMSLSTQAKVLRILQNQQFERLGSSQTICVDVRVIAATNRDLKRAIAAGTFRDDLFYRLNVFPLHIPSLRKRKQDVPMLSRFFLNKYRGEYNKTIEGIHPKGLKKLMEYNWPGNVRELQNVVERSVLMCEGPLIQSHDIDFDASLSESATQQGYGQEDGNLTLDALEYNHIVKILKKTRGVQKDAAKLLGVSPRALHYKIRKHGIEVDKCK